VHGSQVDMKKGFGGANGVVPQTDKAALGYDTGAGSVGTAYQRPVASGAGAGAAGGVRARFEQQAADADAEKRRVDEARAARQEADRQQQVRPCGLVGCVCVCWSVGRLIYRCPGRREGAHPEGPGG
jgi:hypothetical protein